jgi:spore coat protein H
MNQTRPDGAINATNAGGGHMGSPLSLGLTEIGDNWPLIRYLMDDPVYYQMYLDDLDEAVTTSFEPSKMETIYQRYHNLIEPYVTGQYGEQKGYTNLNSASSFTTSLDQLIQQVNSRYEAVMEFLTGERASESSGGV